MRRVAIVAVAASIVGGCSGFSGTVSSLTKGSGQSLDARAQNECQDKYGPLGPTAVSNCTRDRTLELKAAAAPPAPAQ